MLALLSPRRVAIMGASDNPLKAGGRPIHYMQRYGFTGEIYPVNPNRAEVQGLRAYPSLADLPHPPDVVVVALPGSEVGAALGQCIEVGARGAVVYSSGFAELGPEGRRAQQALVTRAQEGGLRIFGPNTQGIANFQSGAILNFSTMINECPPQDGSIAIVSQSGAGAAIVYGGLRRQGLGVRYLIATGNEADISVAETVRGVLDDASLRLVLMYAESLQHPAVLAEAARVATERDIPILAVKSGRTQTGQLTASSHTGAMASEDALADAFLRQRNIIRVQDFHELVEYARLFERRERPKGRRVVAISNSGATCVLAADAMEQNGMQAAEFSDHDVHALRAVLPSYVAARNPIDMTTALLGQPAIYGDALRAVAKSGAAEAFFVGFPIGGEGYDMSGFAAQTADFVEQTGVPVAVCAAQDWVASAFYKYDIPVFASEFRAMRGLALLAEYSKGRALPQSGMITSDRQSGAGVALSEPDSLALLAEAGLPVVAHQYCRYVDHVESAYKSMQAPFVLKGVSAAVTHKSDHGLVRLGVRDISEMGQAWNDYTSILRSLSVEFEGMLVAQQCSSDFELAVGAHWDDMFGPVIMVGQGGVLVEVMKDTQFLVAPFSRQQAQDAIGKLFMARGFAATRGLPAVDTQVLAGMVQRLGDWFASQQGALLSVDANPVLVSRTAPPVVVDAVVIKREC